MKHITCSPMHVCLVFTYQHACLTMQFLFSWHVFWDCSLPPLHPNGMQLARNVSGFPVCFSGNVPPPGEYVPQDIVYAPNEDGCPDRPITASPTPPPFEGGSSAWVAFAISLSGKYISWFLIDPLIYFVSPSHILNIPTQSSATDHSRNPGREQPFMYSYFIFNLVVTGVVLVYHFRGRIMRLLQGVPAFLRRHTPNLEPEPPIQPGFENPALVLLEDDEEEDEDEGDDDDDEDDDGGEAAAGMYNKMLFYPYFGSTVWYDPIAFLYICIFVSYVFFCFVIGVSDASTEHLGISPPSPPAYVIRSGRFSAPPRRLSL